MRGAWSYKGLVGRCFLMYVATGLIVMTGMLLSNRFVSHASWEQLMKTMLGVTVGYALLLLLLLLFTYFRLNITLFSKLPRPPAKLSIPMKQAIWQRLASFPNELFWFYWVTGVAIAQSYRIAVAAPPPWYGEAAINAWKGILFDGSTFFAFAMIHYSLLRWLLHRHLKELDIAHLPKMRFYRMSNRILMIVACGMVYVGLRLFWYAYQAVNKGQAIRWDIFTVIAIVIIVVTLGAMKLAASYLLSDMNRIQSNLQQLQLGRDNSIRPITIVSPYEAGELALAFNSLQHRFVEEYTRLQDEIQLALHVKQQLIPPVELEAKQWLITGSQEQANKEDAHLFQMSERQAEQIILAAGAIRGNAPSAALVMSSLLMLFRTQASQPVSAERILDYINRQLADVLARTMELHMIVVILDQQHYVLEWAMAGEVQLSLAGEEKSIEKAGANSIGSPITASFSCGKQRLNTVDQFRLQYAPHDDDGMTLITGQRRVASL